MSTTTLNVFLQPPTEARPIQSICAILYPQNCSNQTIDYAARFAARYGASVRYVYVMPRPDVPMSYYGPMPVNYAELLGKDVQAMADAAFDLALAAGDRHDVNMQWMCESGDTVAVGSHYLRTSDIGIIGQPTGEHHSSQSAILNALILESAGPMVVVPRFGWEGTIGEKVMIAWDDSQPAARAVNDALDILAHVTQTVDVVSIPGVGTDQTSSNARRKVDEICSYLQHHDVPVNRFVPRASSVDTGSAILNLAVVDKADMLVMGAWGHSRAQEYVFGGVTRSILDRADLPLLVSH